MVVSDGHTAGGACTNDELARFPLQLAQHGN